MTYVIAGSCIKDDSCLEGCPVDCIHPKLGAPDFETAEQLYIDPAVCIDCDACVEACPVDAIFADFELPPKFGYALDLNARFFAEAGTAERTAAWWPAPARGGRSSPPDPPAPSPPRACCGPGATRRSTCSSGCRPRGGCCAPAWLPIIRRSSASS